jgi:hypothetical protein
MKWGRSALLVVAVMGSAAAVQQALTVRDRMRYPAPGLLVHVDGRQMRTRARSPGRFRRWCRRHEIASARD